jgi:hypothetical protein
VSVAVFLVLLGAAVVAVLGLLAVARLRTPSPPVTDAPALLIGRQAVVVLDLDQADSSNPAVARMVEETAARVFASLPDAREVEVRARNGTVLGRSSRSIPSPHDISIPTFLFEPHVVRHPGPDLVAHLGEEEGEEESFLQAPSGTTPKAGPGIPGVITPSEPPPPIAERFDLPQAVQAALRDSDDPLDLVRAILEAGGLSPVTEGDVLRVRELAVVVLGPKESVIQHDALNRAYRRLVASGAERGLVVAFAHLDTKEVWRRELLAPEILHTGVEGVQRMADAVALGADPLRFAVGPALAAAGADAVAS